MGTIIRFVDNGQDFLEWELSELGVVTHCRPFQQSVWEGCVVADPNKLQPGDTVCFAEPDYNGLRYINHPVLEVVHTKPINLSAPVRELEQMFKLSIAHWTQQDFEVALLKEESKYPYAKHLFDQPRAGVIKLLRRCIVARGEGRASL